MTFLDGTGKPQEPADVTETSKRPGAARSCFALNGKPDKFCAYPLTCWHFQECSVIVRGRALPYHIIQHGGAGSFKLSSGPTLPSLKGRGWNAATP